MGRVVPPFPRMGKRTPGKNNGPSEWEENKNGLKKNNNKWGL